MSRCMLFVLSFDCILFSDIPWARLPPIFKMSNFETRYYYSIDACSCFACMAPDERITCDVAAQTAIFFDGIFVFVFCQRKFIGVYARLGLDLRNSYCRCNDISKFLFVAVMGC